MHWNYRVIYFPTTNHFEICEVYYNKKGKPTSYCDADNIGDTVLDLRQDIERKENATHKPILTIKQGKIVKQSLSKEK